MNYLRSLYKRFRQSNNDIRLTSICESRYEELLNTEIRRLIVDQRLIKQLDNLAEIHGKLSCQICTIAVNFLYEYKGEEWWRNAAVYRTDRPVEVDSPYNGGTILLNFVNTEVMDVCYMQQIYENPIDHDGELLKFKTDTKAKVYVGCEPIEESQSVVLTRLNNGGILDKEGKLITLDETVYINSRFAKTKSAKN
jgi:hypothetical protein